MFLLLLVACVWFGLVSFCLVLFLFRSFFVLFSSFICLQACLLACLFVCLFVCLVVCSLVGWLVSGLVFRKAVSVLRKLFNYFLICDCVNISHELLELDGEVYRTCSLHPWNISYVFEGGEHQLCLKCWEQIREDSDLTYGKNSPMLKAPTGNLPLKLTGKKAPRTYHGCKMIGFLFCLPIFNGFLQLVSRSLHAYFFVESHARMEVGDPFQCYPSSIEIRP